MNAPMTIDQLKSAIIAAKRQGYEEATEDVLAAILDLTLPYPTDRECLIYQRISKISNPYGGRDR